MSLPPTFFLVMFDGAPTKPFGAIAECREYLADVFEDVGDSYQVWEIATDADSRDCTTTFARDWAEACDFGSGDDPDEFLKPFPGFVLAHFRESLIETYRAAQNERASEAFESSKIRSL